MTPLVMYRQHVPRLSAFDTIAIMKVYGSTRVHFFTLSEFA